MLLFPRVQAMLEPLLNFLVPSSRSGQAHVVELAPWGTSFASLSSGVLDPRHRHRSKHAMCRRYSDDDHDNDSQHKSRALLSRIAASVTAHEPVAAGSALGGTLTRRAHINQECAYVFAPRSDEVRVSGVQLQSVIFLLGGNGRVAALAPYSGRDATNTAYYAWLEASGNLDSILQVKILSQNSDNHDEIKSYLQQHTQDGTEYSTYTFSYHQGFYHEFRLAPNSDNVRVTRYPQP